MSRASLTVKVVAALIDRLREIRFSSIAVRLSDWSRLELHGFSTSGLCRLTGLPSMKFKIFIIASS